MNRRCRPWSSSSSARPISSRCRPTSSPPPPERSADLSTQLHHCHAPPWSYSTPSHSPRSNDQLPHPGPKFSRGRESRNPHKRVRRRSLQAVAESVSISESESVSVSVSATLFACHTAARRRPASVALSRTACSRGHVPRGLYAGSGVRTSAEASGWRFACAARFVAHGLRSCFRRRRAKNESSATRRRPSDPPAVACRKRCLRRRTSTASGGARGLHVFRRRAQRGDARHHASGARAHADPARDRDDEGEPLATITCSAGCTTAASPTPSRCRSTRSNLDGDGNAVRLAHATTTCFHRDPGHQWNSMHSHGERRHDGRLRHARRQDHGHRRSLRDGLLRRERPPVLLLSGEHVRDRRSPLRLGAQRNLAEPRRTCCSARPTACARTYGGHPDPALPTLFSQLDAHGVSWGVYSRRRAVRGRARLGRVAPAALDGRTIFSRASPTERCRRSRSSTVARTSRTNTRPPTCRSARPGRA